MVHFFLSFYLYNFFLTVNVQVNKNVVVNADKNITLRMRAKMLFFPKVEKYQETVLSVLSALKICSLITIIT